MKHWIHVFRLSRLPSAISHTVVGIAVVLVCSCTANTKNPVSEHEATNAQQFSGHDTLGTKQVTTDQVHEQLNFTDAKGRKQGHWLTKLNGKIWKDEYFKNDLRDSVCKEYFANGDVYIDTYTNGVRNGLRMKYHPDSVSADFQSLYISDTSIYLVFPWELASYIVPVKGWRTDKDSVEVDVKYLTGQPLYHGYLNRSVGYDGAVPYGDHRAYYEDGSLKAIINYDVDSLVVFDRYGQILERTTPRKWHGRQLR